METQIYNYGDETRPPGRWVHICFDQRIEDIDPNTVVAFHRAVEKAKAQGLGYGVELGRSKISDGDTQFSFRGFAYRRRLFSGVKRDDFELGCIGPGLTAYYENEFLRDGVELAAELRSISLNPIVDLFIKVRLLGTRGKVPSVGSRKWHEKLDSYRQRRDSDPTRNAPKSSPSIIDEN